MNGVAFITGASSGLGRGMALRLSRDGWAVGLAARRIDRLGEVAGAARAGGGQVAVCPCDVADRASVHAAVDQAEAELGPVDLLVCNAGTSVAVGARNLDAVELERVLRINFLGAVYPVERVLPGMLERGRGHLVGVGSLVGFGGLPRTAAYGASKAALHSFFESLRVDLRGTGVDVTLLAPGYVKTELTAQNLNRMPLLMELDDAVEIMVKAIRRGARRKIFPAPLATLVWLAQIFPRRLYDALASRVRREKRSGPPGEGGD